MNSLLRYNILVACLLLAADAQAQTKTRQEVIKDPTMPLFDMVKGPQLAHTPLEEDSEEDVPLVLQGIVNKSGRKYAVINNQVLGEGEAIEGFQLTRIDAYTVELKGEEGQLSLTLRKVNIKKSK